MRFHSVCVQEMYMHAMFCPSPFLSVSPSLFLLTHTHSLVPSFFPISAWVFGFPSSFLIYSPSWVSTNSSVIPPSPPWPSFFAFLTSRLPSFSPSLLLLPAGLVNLRDSWQDFISILGVWLWFRGTAKERDICIY